MGRSRSGKDSLAGYDTHLHTHIHILCRRLTHVDTHVCNTCKSRIEKRQTHSVSLTHTHTPSLAHTQSIQHIWLLALERTLNGSIMNLVRTHSTVKTGSFHFMLLLIRQYIHLELLRLDINISTC